ncbi:MAG: hypothetical protein ACKVS9_18315 [Phycisphaerae bacterium]
MALPEPLRFGASGIYERASVKRLRELLREFQASLRRRRPSAPPNDSASAPFAVAEGSADVARTKQAEDLAANLAAIRSERDGMLTAIGTLANETISGIDAELAATLKAIDEDIAKTIAELADATARANGEVLDPIGGRGDVQPFEHGSSR